MGMADWFMAQQEVMDAAQREAAEMHARFGNRALSFCRDEMITADTRAQRRELARVERVLRRMLKV